MDNDKMPTVEEEFLDALDVLWRQHGNDDPGYKAMLPFVKQIAELLAEANEQARLNGIGAEREARLMAQVAELRAERDALANTDAGSALALLSRMRFACGDNGLRMQDELEDYLRALAKDAARYRWLREGGLYRVGFDSTGSVSLSVLDSAIDAAMAEGER